MTMLLCSTLVIKRRPNTARVTLSCSTLWLFWGYAMGAMQLLLPDPREQCVCKLAALCYAAGKKVVGMSKPGGPEGERRLADECQERCGPGQLAGRWCYKGHRVCVCFCVKEKSKKDKRILHTHSPAVDEMTRIFLVCCAR
jgi:hypothetical protein